MLSYCCMETLQEIIKPITGIRRQVILMRVAGMDASVVMNLANIKRGTYNSWFKNEEFNAIYHRIPELAKEHRQEAVQMLRKGNQLEAVLLESKIIQQLKNEVESGELNLAKTNLAREVYSKLMTDLDAAPKVEITSWRQRIDYLQHVINPEELEGGKVIDAEFEEDSSIEKEHTESKLISEGKSIGNEDKA